MESCFIPEDLLIEIFARLPVKSLIRFKCVSKAWRDSIRSSSFKTLHFDRNKNKHFSYINMTQTFMQLVTRDGESTLLHRSYLKDSDKYGHCKYNFILGSASNGLVCFYRDSFTIWNPATRVFRIIPDQRGIRSPKYRQRYLEIKFRHGFDSRPCGDYSVVVIAFLDGEVEGVQIYGSRSNCWKNITDDVTVPAKEERNDPKAEYSEAASLNGSMYWTVCEINSSQNVVCFDIWKEKFTTITGPLYSDLRLGKLGVINGSYLGMFYSGDSGNLEGWVMNPDDRSWSKRISVVIYSPSLKLNKMVKKKAIILLDKGMYFYEPSTKRLGCFPKCDDQLGVVQYKETFFPV